MALLYSIILSCACISGVLLSKSEKKVKLKIPRVTLIVAIILFITFIIQSIYPETLAQFQRDEIAIVEGEFWRVFTALFFQDGGLAGAVFNITALLFVGSIAEHYFRKLQWLILFFIGGILTGIIAIFWQPIGAGNSIANFSLAGGLLIYSLLQQNNTVKIITIVGLVASIYLLFMKDIHGVAIFIGIYLWSMRRCFIRVRPRQNT